MKIIIDISRQDYVDLNKFHFFRTMLKSVIINGVLLVVMIQLFLNNQQFNLVETIISSVVFMFIYLFIINRNLNQTKNIPDNNGIILGQKEIEFTENKIIYKAANSEGSFDWVTIKKLEESSKAFYLYMDTNMVIFIPKRSFNDKIEQEIFKTLVSQKISTV